MSDDPRPLLEASLVEMDACLASGDWSPFFAWTEGTRSEGGVIHLPYPRYGAAEARMWKAYEACGFDYGGHDYIGWENRFGRRPEDPDTIAAMTRDDLLFFLTKCSRGERFCDGHIAGLLEDGVFRAVTARWLAVLR